MVRRILYSSMKMLLSSFNIIIFANNNVALKRVEKYWLETLQKPISRPTSPPQIQPFPHSTLKSGVSFIKTNQRRRKSMGAEVGAIIEFTLSSTPLATLLPNSQQLIQQTKSHSSSECLTRCSKPTILGDAKLWRLRVYKLSSWPRFRQEMRAAETRMP